MSFRPISYKGEAFFVTVNQGVFFILGEWGWIFGTPGQEGGSIFFDHLSGG